MIRAEDAVGGDAGNLQDSTQMAMTKATKSSTYELVLVRDGVAAPTAQAVSDRREVGTTRSRLTDERNGHERNP